MICDNFQTMPYNPSISAHSEFKVVLFKHQLYDIFIFDASPALLIEEFGTELDDTQISHITFTLGLAVEH